MKILLISKLYNSLVTQWVTNWVKIDSWVKFELVKN